ncbi:MAG: leucine-rich repeat protein [Muribaculaceae bacterium]|nr:leucine-rich repeat protein [Muribaculaceae bacterium]
MELKRLFRTSLLALIAAMIPSAASAYTYNFDFMVDGLCYNINSDGTSVTVTYQGTGQYGYGYANLSGILDIPSTVANNGVSYTVTSIGEYAFSNCTGLTSVDIPNTVADIGQAAFWGCIGLTSVNIPNSVAVIGKTAFSNCIGLSSVDIPNSVTSIGENAFADCISMTSATLPDSLTTIITGLFTRCRSLTSVNIPDLVTSIGNSAFSGCASLTSVNIPDLVTSIGNYAFSGCAGLTSLTISNLVTSIGNYAFAGCGLTSIIVENGNPNYDSRDNCNAIIETATNTLLAGCKNTVIPNSVTSIGTGAFSGCNGLTSVTIPSSVTTIGDLAFKNCTNLTAVNITDLASWCNIDFIGSESNPLCHAHNLYLNGNLITDLSIPSTVSQLKNSTFYGGNFTSLTIPNTVTSIGVATFYDCAHLTTVTINNKSIVSKDYSSGSSSGSTIQDIFGPQVQNYIIGDLVTLIGNSAFSSCTGLTSVTIGNSVTRIGTGAFSGCSGLTSITLPSSLKYINNQAFSGCSGLTSLTLPGSLFTIGNQAFRDCSSLTSMTIPSSVLSIGEGIFTNCSSLASIAVESGNTSYDSRDNCNAIIKNQVYDNRWGTLIAGCMNTIIPNTVRDISSGAFAGCTGLNSVTIPHGVKRLCNFAYSNCNFTSVTIHNTLDSYGDESNMPFIAFYGGSDRWDTLTVVGNGAWTEKYIYIQNPIKALYIGSGITNLDISMYSGKQFALNVLNCYAETPPEVGQYTQYVFSPSCYNGELHVPAGSAEAYSSAEFWKDFSNIIPDLTDKVTLDKRSASLTQGRTLKLNVTEIPDGGEVIWCTSNPYVATVDSSGTVTATGDGGCDIYATLASNPAVYGSCHINVNNAEIFEGYNGYLKFQVIDEENHKVALVGYNEAIGVDLASNNWGIQFPDEPVQVPSVVTYAGEEYTVTEIADNALKGLGYFSNPQRYDNFYPMIVLPETVRRIGKHALQTNPESPCTEVVLPHSLEILDDECLLQGGGGGTYMLHENVKEIGNNVFSGMMISVMFNNHNFELTPSMFNLDDLTVLCLWNENLSIAANTFNGPTLIDRLVLGVYPCTIASNAFGGNTQINKIAVYSLEPYELPEDAFSSSIYQNTKLIVPAAALESYRNAPGWKNFVNIVSFSYGDIDYDGVITSSDITALYNHLLDGDMMNIGSIDVDGDGAVTGADITAVYNLLIGN